MAVFVSFLLVDESYTSLLGTTMSVTSEWFYSILLCAVLKRVEEDILQRVSMLLTDRTLELIDNILLFN